MNNNKNSSNVFKIIFVISIMFLGLSGCSDNPVQQTNTTQPGGNNLQMSTVAVNTANIPQNPLVLSEAKIMIKDIKLHNDGQESGSCETINIGPVVLPLQLNSNVNVIFNSSIPPGTYDKIRFQIHKLSELEKPPDPDFMDADGRYSVIVKGTFNGIVFKFKSSISASQQELEFSRKFKIARSIVANITLLADPLEWFMNNNMPLDPMNPSNRHIIEMNIRNNIHNSMRIFEDEDHDGHPDGGS
jgi:hypothetical protein